VTTAAPRRRAKHHVVTVRRPTAAAWRQALRLADGDPRRLDVRPDGSVVVHNKPVR
jgi:hypothetical protein